jgi:hypothetical protein
MDDLLIPKLKVVLTVDQIPHYIPLTLGNKTVRGMHRSPVEAFVVHNQQEVSDSKVPEGNSGVH